MARLTREELEREWQRQRPQDPESARHFLERAAQLVPDEERQLLRGKRVELRRLAWGQSQASAYNAEAVAAIGGALRALGLVRADAGWRDAASGVRCKARLVELARLAHAWDTPADRAWLKEQWPRLARLPLPALKAFVREHNGRARSKGQGTARALALQLAEIFEVAAGELSAPELRALAGEFSLYMHRRLAGRARPADLASPSAPSRPRSSAAGAGRVSPPPSRR